MKKSIQLSSRKLSSRFRLPDISKCNKAQIWFEDSKGDKTVLTAKQMRNGLTGPDPKRFPFVYIRFPLQIVTRCYKRRYKDGGYGNKDLMFTGEQDVPGDLAVKLVVNSNYSMHLREAFVICATACERCMNILAWQNGLSWGYSPKSEEAKRCRTSCDLCGRKT